MAARTPPAAPRRGERAIASVIVNDFDILWPGFRPVKAEPELVVDADAVLAMAVSPERLQAVAWWNLQIVEACGGIKNGELAQGELAEGPRERCSKAPHRLSRKQGLGVSATKRPDTHRYLTTARRRARQAVVQGDGDHELTWRPGLPVFFPLQVPPPSHPSEDAPMPLNA